MVGKYVASKITKKFTVAVDTVNSMIVEFPDFIPALEMKAKVIP
jgi:hypothetical protein